MGISFDVYILDSEDEPVEGVEVTALFPSLPIGGVTLEEYTDSGGHASFETAGDHHKEVTLLVRGEKFGPYDLEEGVGLTLNVS